MDNPAVTPRSAPPTDDTDTGPAVSSPPTQDTTEGSVPGSESNAGDPATDGTEPGLTTTTAPRARPTSADVELLAFAQSFELTARDLYQAAIDAGAEGDEAAVFEALRDNHEEYGNFIAGIIGVDAPQRRDDALYDELKGGFGSSDAISVAEAAYDFESTAVATHTELIGQVEGVDGARALAGLLVTESRHCTVLAYLAGKGDDLDALVQNDAEALALPGSAGS